MSNAIQVHSFQYKNNAVNSNNAGGKETKLTRKAGEFLSAVVTKITDGRAVLETKDRLIFEGDAEALNASVGDELRFKILKNDKSGVTLQQVRKETHQSAETVNQISADSLLEMMKKHGLAVDEDADGIKPTDANADMDKKTMEALARIKRQLAYPAANATKSAIRELAASGLSLEKVNISIFNSIIKEIEQKPERKLSRSELDEIVSEVSSEETEKKRRIIKTLAQKELRINDRNIAALESALDKFGELSEEGIALLLKGSKPLTIENIYIARYSAVKNIDAPVIDEKAFAELLPQIEKAFIRDGIEVNEENLKIAKLLLDNEITITGDNMKKAIFLSNIMENIDNQDLLDAACMSIKEGKPIGDIELYELPGQVEQRRDTQKLVRDYDTLIRDIPRIPAENIELLLKRQMPITLNNLRTLPQEARNALNANYSAMGEDISVAVVTAKRQLAEVALKLTREAAMRLAGKNIRIDSMPLEEVVENLRAVENEGYAKHLRIMGAEETPQNMEAMAGVFDKVRDFRPLNNNIFAALLLNRPEFTINGIHGVITAQRAAEEYESFATVPNAKFGDSFSLVREQIAPLLSEMEIEANDANIRAASVLSRNKMDITEESLTAIKIIDGKINAIYDRLHPNIAAQMLREGLNPADMHVDEVLAYIDSFNGQYGEGLADKIAGHIMRMDGDKSLDPELRGGMIAVYRMLNAINRDGGVSLGVSLKKDAGLTLGNLMEDARYYQRTRGAVSDIDARVDDESDIRQRRNDSDSIRSLLEKAHADAAAEIMAVGGESQLRDTEELLRESPAGMADTADNLLRADDVLQNIPDNAVKALLDYEYAWLNLTRFAEEAQPDRLERLMEEDDNFLGNTPEEALEALRSIDWGEEAPQGQLERINSIIQEIENSSAAVVLWMERNDIPPTLNNIIGVQNLIKDSFFISRSLEELDEELDIPEEVTAGTHEDALGKVSQQLQSIKESADSGKKIEQINLIQNAVKVQNFIQRRGDNSYYQMPLRLRERIAGLNMYVLNEKLEEAGEAKVFMSLDTESLGEVSIYMHTNGDTADLSIFTQTVEATDILRNNADALRDFAKTAGVELNQVQFGTRESRNILRQEVMPTKNINVRAVAGGEFEFSV